MNKVFYLLHFRIVSEVQEIRKEPYITVQPDNDCEKVSCLQTSRRVGRVRANARSRRKEWLGGCNNTFVLKKHLYIYTKKHFGKCNTIEQFLNRRLFPTGLNTDTNNRY